MTKEHATKIIKGAGIALGGALLAYLSQVIPNEDFGKYTPLVTAAFSILINIGLKYIDATKGATVTLHERYNDETDQ